MQQLHWYRKRRSYPSLPGREFPSPADSESFTAVSTSERTSDRAVAETRDENSGAETDCGLSRGRLPVSAGRAEVTALTTGGAE